jgi:hypothetical protein
MRLEIPCPHAWLLVLCLLAACGGAISGDRDMKKYLEFYFPTTGAASYTILYDWGEYLVITEAGPRDELHPDTEPYRGFVTMRPYPAEGTSVVPAPPIYCITPAGEVWTTTETAAVPAIKKRVEVQDKGGGTVLTTTIESPGEAVIDSFHDDREIWARFGTLEVKGGKTRFKAVRP